MDTGICSRRSALIAVGGVFLAGLGLSGCAGKKTPGQGSSAGSGTYCIGILKLTEHAALDDAERGFLAALDETGLSYTADKHSAQNDQSACQTIAAKLVSDGCDLIFAIATPAAQAVAGATTEIPIVGTAITDFAAAGLVKDNGAPGTNVTGTSDLTPVAEQLALMKKAMPKVQRVGILYCSAEANSAVQVEMAEAELKELGIEAKRLGVSSSNEIQSVVEGAVGEVDAFYAPTDNTISASMAQVASIARDAQIPVVCGEEAQVGAGGLFSLSVSYADLGHRAGEMAYEILQNKQDPATMPIEHMKPEDLSVVINENLARELGVDVDALKA